jgi:hypothetical protein
MLLIYKKKSRCILMLGHIEIKCSELSQIIFYIWWRGFQWRYSISSCISDFDSESQIWWLVPWYVSCFSIEIFQNNSRKLFSTYIVLFWLCCSLTYNICVLSVALSHFLSLISKIWCRRTKFSIQIFFHSKLKKKIQTRPYAWSYTNVFRAITSSLLYMVKRFPIEIQHFSMQCRFWPWSPNLTIGMFLVSALRSSQIIQASLNFHCVVP